jgi:hypothetical protein
MGIQSSTNNSPDLLRMRAAYVDRHKLRDFRLSGRSLMRLVRSRCVDKAVVDEIRARFTISCGTDLQMESRTWDHLEMFGHKGALVALIAHPYHITDEGREDMALLHRANLNVIEGGEDESWYGFSTTQIRVEHPWLAGRMLPPPKAAPKPVEPAPESPVKGALRAPLNSATSPGRFPAETAYERRLQLAAPRLLELARERAAELAAAIAMIPCVGPRSGAPCIRCELRADLDRINAVLLEVGGPDSTEPPLFGPDELEL